MKFRILSGRTLEPIDAQAKKLCEANIGKPVLLNRDDADGSEQRKRMFDYVDWLYDNYGRAYPGREAFRYYLSIKANHCKMELRMDKKGDWFNVIEAKTWSDRCPQKELDALERNLDKIGQELYGAGLYKWIASQHEYQEA